MRTLMFIFLCLIGFPALADDLTLEIKGFHVGMSEREVKARYLQMQKDEHPSEAKKKNARWSTLTCENSPKKDRFQYSNRHCSAILFLIDSVGMTDFYFYKDTLGIIDVDIVTGKFKTYADALTEKYGAPTTKRNGGIFWNLNHTELMLGIINDDLHMFFDSDFAVDEIRHRKTDVLKNNASKL